MKKLFIISCLIVTFASIALAKESRIGLTLIPPGTITNKVDLDIRAGIVNNESIQQDIKVSIYLNKVNQESMLHYSRILLSPGESHEIKFVLNTADKTGKNRIILQVQEQNEVSEITKDFEVVNSDIRSTRLIDGAWAGIYHWSDIEGKHWNSDIQKMTDDQWRELVRSMHSIGMDVIVLQEVFRNQDYVGNHNLTVENYQGKAFYPSALYPGRMPITAKDPVEAILKEADALGMSVMMGVGMFAWFDFTAQSLEWHKRVARELWDLYGHHPSFYGFYISEECAGNLYNSETTVENQLIRKKEIVDFFREFKKYTSIFAPEKPVMLATNSMEVLKGADTYPALLQNLDILCPFGFARMPEGDLTGKEAADLLQKFCDNAGAHLWFDLEAFLFNPDNSLYPRPIEEIIHDLNLLDIFEKVLCYQYPGVFNNPKMSIRIGEERTIQLYNAYKAYMKKIKAKRR